MNLKQFIQELKRRNVIKAIVAYAVVSWILIQVFSIIFPLFDAPDYLLKIIIAIIVVLFPLWIIFSWVYEITPDGIKKTLAVDPDQSITHKTSNRLDKIILGALGIAIVLMVLILNRNENPVQQESNNESLIEEVTDDKSIAVLAFADMSPDKDQEYFSDGISEEILNLLAKIPELKVISRTSSFSYKGQEQNIIKIGEELKVGHVLEGSVRKAGNELRITAQLIDAQSGAHLWSETFDRKLEDVFKIQDEIAAMISKQLRLTIMGELPNQQSMDPEAHDLYLQAKAFSILGGEQNIMKAYEHINAAIALNSAHVPSLRLRGDLVSALANVYGKIPPDEAQRRIIADAEKALSLEPENVGAHLLLSITAAQRLDLKAMWGHLKKAEALHIEHADDYRILGYTYTLLGKLPQALEFIKQAVALDPLKTSNYFLLGHNYNYLEDWDQVEAMARKIELLDPRANQRYNELYGMAAFGRGEYQKAYGYFETLEGFFWPEYYNCITMYVLEQTGEADKALDALIEKYAHLGGWVNIANIYAFIKDRDNAFKWLNLAIDKGDGGTLEIINDPAFKNLHGDPRWNTFIARLNLPEDHGFHVD